MTRKLSPMGWTICPSSWSSLWLLWACALCPLLQSTGKTFYSMVIQLVGAGLNIVLDPIMIFGLLGCPAMGVAVRRWLP